MAWRIDAQIVRGEIDNRTPGLVTGKLWLIGRDEAVELKLEGNPWRDLAGHVLKFTNPEPKPGTGGDLASWQKGVVGDMTASRKVRVPDCSEDELVEFFKTKQPFPWHWGNSLYLEWFSETNGRVVIESAQYQLELDAEPAWILTEGDEKAQQAAAAAAMVAYMERMGMAIADAGDFAGQDDHDDDLPQSAEEAAADEEDARMQLLLDRVIARIERDGFDEIEDYDRIYEEERARLMKERGETEPELTPEQLEERARWVEEMNAIAEEAMADYEAEKWKDGEFEEDQRHPLVDQCSDLAVEISKQIRAAGWMPEDAHQEHPISEIRDGVMIASAKLGGALGMADEEWPPEPLFAGNVIVRLKKARGYLNDALRGLDAAEEEALATPQWRHETRIKVIDVLAQTEELLREARAVYQSNDEEKEP
jgi:hypothetical protein